MRNKVQKLVGFLTYELASFRVHKASISTTNVVVGIKIQNASNTAVSLENYRLQLYYLPKSGEKQLLAESKVKALNIKANGQTIETTSFNVSNLSSAKALYEMYTTNTTSLKGRLSVLVKAGFKGQYVEKEFKYV